MMPILWRYLLSHYLKVLLFCTVAFIALLLTLRLEEIAHFATLGPQGIYILYFTFYQIPYILPIALPIAALISSMILVKYLCKNHEMTALRSAGFSIGAILTPLMLAAAFLSLANFYVVSELATNSHLSSSLIKNELRAINPLLLLSNKHLMKLRGIYFDTLGASRLGESASDTLIAIPNQHTRRISLLLAKNLQASPQDFSAKSLTLFSTVEDGEGRERVIIENMEKNSTAIKDFTQMIQPKVWTLNNDHLQMPLLLCRLREYLEFVDGSPSDARTDDQIKSARRHINSIYSEIVRRISVALAVFTFTLLGACAGLSVGRQVSVKRVLLVVILGALYVSAYFTAKGIDHRLVTSLAFYTLPHLLIVVVAAVMFSKASRGVE
jgi:lipopolysaccharide export system permease protein